MPIIPAFRKLGRKDKEFKVSLGCISNSCLQKQISKKGFSGKVEIELKRN
jgi:hypothetical protein